MRSHTPALFAPMPLRRRMWQGAVLIFAFIMTVILANGRLPADQRISLKMLGQDFLPFYTAGTFVREGHWKSLYDLDSVREYEQAVAKVNGIDLAPHTYGPWWNPPFYAWAFAPLSKLPFPQALATWWLVSFLCLLGSLVLLIDMLPKAWKPFNQGAHSSWLETARDWRTTGLLLLLTIISMPAIQALSHGQNTCTSLLLLCLTVTAWRKQRPLIAGLIGGLLFYKPQLAAVLAGVMVLSMGWRALVGFGFTGCILLSLTEWSMPGATELFLTQLPANLHFMRDVNTYAWERHVTLKALFRLFFQGREAAETSMLVSTLTFSLMLVFATALFHAILTLRRRVDDPWTGETLSIARDRLIAATICVTPLLMPFYFDYDLLLLVVPAVLLAGDVLQRSEERTVSEKWLTRSWGVLFTWMYFNVSVAANTHVNVTTILLGVVAMQMLARANRKSAVLSGIDIRGTIPFHSPMRAAA